MNFDLSYFVNSLPRLLSYLPITLMLAVLSMLFAVILGIILEAMIRSPLKVIAASANAYILFFRSTPLLVQLFLLYYGLPQIFPALSAMDAFQATIIGISLNNGAYLAEIFRGAIDSVDRGQMEAAQSVGMTRMQAFRRIVFPQAYRIALPSLGNTFLVIIKETSLGFTLGLTEMMGQAKLMAADTLKVMETFLSVSLLYLIVALLFGKFQGKLEKKVGRPYAR
ncbi:amino acid ABC transporter permease [Paenibacillus sp. GSMTC-2017]|uniref:amino acid ABC transporter permease n=1 Tax=Paenibacillus sp. GSMTC-2017 TaxID=2794350 RepID=UPI0018D81CF3|nr:amino acid ABC transporter permease [Paenibacillus sp. GSMTC-2017]MBH5318726.1 amino acid ABC transporter permease [Paenibacillus sp. GSMTC-2017]